MRAFRHNVCTLDDYYEIELKNERKFEFWRGAIVAMAGGSPRHNVLAVRVTAALLARFPRCSVMGSDQRVATGDGLHTYPDASVVCGEMELSRYPGTETLHNPMLLVEVLSPSTRDYDLGEKLEHYQTILALRDVLLIEAEAPDVRHVRRTAEGWETRRFRGAEAIVDLAGVTLPLAELYPPSEE